MLDVPGGRHEEESHNRGRDQGSVDKVEDDEGGGGVVAESAGTGGGDGRAEREPVLHMADDDRSQDKRGVPVLQHVRGGHADGKVRDRGHPRGDDRVDRANHSGEIELPAPGDPVGLQVRADGHVLEGEAGLRGGLLVVQQHDAGGHPSVLGQGARRILQGSGGASPWER